MLTLKCHQEAKEHQIAICFFSRVAILGVSFSVLFFLPNFEAPRRIILKKIVWVYSQVIWKLPNNSTKLIQHSGDTYSLRLSQFYNMESSSHLEQRRNAVERQRRQTIRNDWQMWNIKRHLERATKEKQIHMLSEQNTKQGIPRNRSDWSMWIMQKYRSATRGAPPNLRSICHHQFTQPV